MSHCLNAERIWKYNVIWSECVRVQRLITSCHQPALCFSRCVCVSEFQGPVHCIYWIYDRGLGLYITLTSPSSQTLRSYIYCMCVCVCVLVWLLLHSLLTVQRHWDCYGPLSGYKQHTNAMSIHTHTHIEMLRFVEEPLVHSLRKMCYWNYSFMVVVGLTDDHKQTHTHT